MMDLLPSVLCFPKMENGDVAMLVVIAAKFSGRLNKRGMFHTVTSQSGKCMYE